MAFDAVANNDPETYTDPLNVGLTRLADVCKTKVFPVPVVGVGSP